MGDARMNVFIYQAALWCETCIDEITEELVCPGDPDDEHTFDSDDYPKGPHSDGGGESDTPQHCEGCGEFLENALTADGIAYVEERVREAEASSGLNEVIKLWKEFYL